MLDSMRQSFIRCKSYRDDGTLFWNEDCEEDSDLVELSLEFFPSIEY